jgi:asparagine synthase (glutamine-hydrolysing)
MLSGGLDSTAVAAIAVPLLERVGHRVPAFTGVPASAPGQAMPPGWFWNERPLVEAMGRRYAALDLNFVAPEPGFFLDGVDRYFEAAESPLHTGFNRPWIDRICADSARRGISVLLSGQAGNLTVSWTGGYLMTHLLTSGYWLRALREAGVSARSGMSRSAGSALLAGLAPLLPDGFSSALFRIRHRNDPRWAQGDALLNRSLIHPEFAREQGTRERASDLGYSFRFGFGRHTRARLLDLGAASADATRAWESLYNVQLRAPADDQRIVQFCLAAPEELFARDGESRRLIRRAMRGAVPDEILDNPRRGLQGADWVDRLCLSGRQWKDEIDWLVSSPLAAHVLDVTRLHRAIERLNTDPTMFDGSLVGTAVMTSRFIRWTETGS